MKLLCSLLLCALLAAARPVSAASAPADENLTNSARPRGLITRLLHPIRKDEKPGDDAKPIWKGLALGLVLEPQPLKLSDARQLKVSVLLINKGKKTTQLDFPTTQRIEVVVKNGDGKLVEQWSEDHSFTNEPGIININPGERLEYLATISTREMKPFESYTIEAFFPRYDALKVQRVIVPGK